MWPMLSDRSYMRNDYPRERTSVLTWLLCAIAGGFIMQMVLRSEWFGSGMILEREFGLTSHGLRQGWVWTLFTHAFLHDPQNPLHGIAVMLMLYFLGGELLPLLGPRRFLGLFFGAIVTGGLTWTAAHWHTADMHLGSMAAVDALLVVFACFYPNRQMDFLLFFVFPVRLRPRHVVLGLLCFDLIGLCAYELLGAARPFDRIAFSPSAHLGGMLAGWVYFRFMHDARWRALVRFKPRDGADLPDPDDVAADSVAMPARDIRAEVDRILDKINSHGFASLTPQEKRVLDEAKHSLSRR